MARRKSSGKSTALSQEYIVDSDSDAPTDAPSSVEKVGRSWNQRVPQEKKQKKGSLSPEANVAQAENLDSDGTMESEKETATASPSPSPSGSSSNEEATETGGKSRASQQPQEKRTASRVQPIHVSIPAKPFQPPHGFHKIRAERSDFSTDALEALAGGLAGKQIWHISTPASVSLASVKEFNFNAVKSGEPILTHKNRHYGFTNVPKDLKHLLLPSGTELTYKRLKTSISKSYHLREILDHSQMEHMEDGQSPEASNFFAKEIPLAKPPPQQPEMLKMRYIPFGVDEISSPPTGRREIFSSEDREFQAPLQSPPQPPESTPKKRKKHKRIDPKEQNGLVDDPMEIDATPNGAARVQEPSLQSDPPFSEPPVNMNSIYEHIATPVGKKKKKKKKSRDEQSS